MAVAAEISSSTFPEGMYPEGNIVTAHPHCSAESQRLRIDTANDFAILFAVDRCTSAEVVIAGRRFPFQGTPRQTLVIPPHSQTEWFWVGSHHVIQLRIQNGNPVWQAHGQGADFWVFRFRQDARLATLCVQLYDELNSCELGSDFSAQALAQLIRVHVCRGSSPQRCGLHKGGLPPRRLQCVLEWIDAHLGSNIMLTDLSRLADLSPQHFCRMFKQSVGVTPHRYITSKRVERARKLLADPSRSLVQVALETGFPSQSHFGCIFRKLTGTTPGKFRASL